MYDIVCSSMYVFSRNVRKYEVSSKEKFSTRCSWCLQLSHAVLACQVFYGDGLSWDWFPLLDLHREERASFEKVFPIQFLLAGVALATLALARPSDFGCARSSVVLCISNAAFIEIIPTTYYDAVVRFSYDFICKLSFIVCGLNCPIWSNTKCIGLLTIFLERLWSQQYCMLLAPKGWAMIILLFLKQEMSWMLIVCHNM